MANLLAALLLLLLLLAGVTWLVRAWRNPARRLRRDFKRLRALLLKQLLPEQRPEAARTLDTCDDFLSALIASREQLQLLERMTHDAAHLTGAQPRSLTPEALPQTQERITQQLNAFFSQLGHIAASAGLHRESTLDELRDLAHHLDDQRRAIALLHRELREPLPDSLEARFDALEKTEAADQQQHKSTQKNKK